MGFSDENMVMPVAPTGFGGGFGNGFGGDGFWIILLFILLGGYGNGFGGYGNGGGVGFVDNSVQRGFDQSAIMNGLTGIGNSIVSGFGDVQTALCGGFAGVNAGIANGFAQMEIAANARQMADMNRSFDLQSQFANCCCENRLATVGTQNIVQAEGAATRLAIQEQTQAILDKMCQQEIDNLKAQNVALQNQVNMQNLAASQNAQTAALVADNTAQTQYIVNRVAPYPIPAYTVPNPNTPATTTGA